MRQIATITVIGQDKTGVIARVTSFLFGEGANIEALEEQVTRGQFSMTIQASWRATQWHVDRVRSGLERLAEELGMEIRLRHTEPHRRQRFAVLVTREAHCCEFLLQAWQSGKLKADPALILSNRPQLKPLAESAGIPFRHLAWEDRTKAENKALGLLERYEVDFVVLARFMKILSPNFVWRFKNKIINIHPSLLPSFPGPQAYRQAYERGVKIAGATVHFVTMHLDEGPIIAQQGFPIRSGMLLKQIVAAGQKVEAQLLVKGLQLYLTKRLDVYWGVVREV